MELNEINILRSFIKDKKKFITQYGINSIKDKEKRSIYNIKTYSGIDFPDWVNSTRDILDLLDNNSGICERHGCKNKKNRDGTRWALRKFCSRKCADLDFAGKQRGNSNSFHNISDENRLKMGNKISEKIAKRIADGEFTPNITNSWSNSKIRVLINGSLIFVRSSWEAYFYILNPGLAYELIRIPYFDSKKECFRNYITDFCDPINKIIYEIKPKSKIKESDDKLKYAKKWCIDNCYEYRIITQEWIIERYSRRYLDGQPDGNRISYLIEKMMKYEN